MVSLLHKPQPMLRRYQPHQHLLSIIFHRPLLPPFTAQTLLTLFSSPHHRRLQRRLQLLLYLAIQSMHHQRKRTALELMINPLHALSIPGVERHSHEESEHQGNERGGEDEELPLHAHAGDVFEDLALGRWGEGLDAVLADVGRHGHAEVLEGLRDGGEGQLSGVVDCFELGGPAVEGAERGEAAVEIGGPELVDAVDGLAVDFVDAFSGDERGERQVCDDWCHVVCGVGVWPPISGVFVEGVVVRDEGGFVVELVAEFGELDTSFWICYAGHIHHYFVRRSIFRESPVRESGERGLNQPGAGDFATEGADTRYHVAGSGAIATAGPGVLRCCIASCRQLAIWAAVGTYSDE